MEDDVFVGQCCLERRLISIEALLECLFQMARERRQRMPRPLGAILVARGVLSKKELEDILSKHAPATIEAVGEMQLGALLVASGLLLQEELDHCLKLQEAERRAGRAPPRLGEVAVQQGYATPEQIARLLAYKSHELLACPRCGVRTVAPALSPGTQYTCKRCGEKLVSPGATTSAATARQTPARCGSDERQLEVDRAIGVYLEQQGKVRLDLLREGQHLQEEFRRYGLVVPLLDVLRRQGAITSEQKADLEKLDFAAFAQDPEWKGQLVPGYRLGARETGAGHAVLYAATRAFDGTTVSVKLLHPELKDDPRLVTRFEREARLLCRLKSPEIARGIECGTHGDQPYVVLERFNGRSLAQVVSDTGPLPLRAALSASRGVARALACLHAEGYAHRNVRLDSVCVDDEGRALLWDVRYAAPLGWASPSSPGARANATGHPEAPEDAVCLGLLLYGLLVGADPWAGCGSNEAVADRLEWARPAPSLAWLDAPASVVGFLRRTLCRNGGRKRVSVAALAAEIEELAKA